MVGAFSASLDGSLYITAYRHSNWLSLGEFSETETEGKLKIEIIAVLLFSLEERHSFTSAVNSLGFPSRSAGKESTSRPETEV